MALDIAGSAADANAALGTPPHSGGSRAGGGDLRRVASRGGVAGDTAVGRRAKPGGRSNGSCKDKTNYRFPLATPKL